MSGTEYHKINTIFKRDEKTGALLSGQFSCPEFEYLRYNKWLFSEKIDGTNIRLVWDGSTLSFGGKTDAAQIPVFLVEKLKTLFPAEKFVAQFGPTPAVLYGEGYGAKIQKGGGNYIPNGVDFILFDVRIKGWWLRRGDVAEIAEKIGTQRAPEIGSGTLEDALDMAESGFRSKFGDFIAEGLVLRPEVELQTRSGERVITKIKCRDFRLSPLPRVGGVRVPIPCDVDGVPAS